MNCTGSLTPGKIIRFLNAYRFTRQFSHDFNGKTLRRNDESGIEDFRYLSDRTGRTLQQYGFTLAL